MEHRKMEDTDQPAPEESLLESRTEWELPKRPRSLESTQRLQDAPLSSCSE
jgi:hypothetical protein